MAPLTRRLLPPGNVKRKHKLRAGTGWIDRKEANNRAPVQVLLNLVKNSMDAMEGPSADQTCADGARRG
jgi:C4-dicarboxylate-specific signal transduction histidine kinase